MKRSLVLLLVLVTGCSSHGSSAGGSPPAPAAAPPAVALTAAPEDTLVASRQRFAAEVLASIAGREQQPTDSVFQNIKRLKGMPAARLVRIMETGFSRSLGVTCTHCHEAGKWASDAKPEKQIARDMLGMSARINNELLKGIPNLKSATPTVNCTTCHRGQVKPALDLPGAERRPGS